MTLSIIAAISFNRIIGRNGMLPWHIPMDLKHFKEKTTGHHMIMGRRTFESIGALPNRISIVLTSDRNYKAKGALTATTWKRAIELCGKEDEEIFVIGGAQVFESAILIADKLYITWVNQFEEGDTYFPKIDNDIWSITSTLEKETGEYSISFTEYERKHLKHKK